ncbi:methyltransferase domain-containing protein, partial [Streptomyces sp. NPDC001508]|uniref:methyltransferase domain-containing protein n=1 Tax=Streptomyces sp. NPDC001508 TaxID=3154656 RepID=UPI00331DCD56
RGCSPSRASRSPRGVARPAGSTTPIAVSTSRAAAIAPPGGVQVLERCEGTVLDVGCGSGRLVAALAARGRCALGTDVSEAAVRHTVRSGGQALCRSVFERFPGEGRWGTLLLMDGDIGIGGDPGALLLRPARLAAPAVLLVVETAPLDVDERVRVQVVRAGGAVGSPSPRARLGTSALLRCARRTGRRAVGPSVSGRRAGGASPPCAAAPRAPPRNRRTAGR